LNPIKGVTMKRLFARKYAIVAGSALAALAIGGTALATNGFSSWSANQHTSGGPYTAATLTLAASSSSVLTQSVSGLQPGYHTEIPVTVANSGTVPFGSISLGVTASPSSSALVSGTGSLDIEIQTCTVPWTPSTVTINGIAVTTYSCTGTVSTALGVSPSSASAQTSVESLLSSPSALTGANLGINSNNNYLITLSMPTNAPNSDQSQSVSLSYIFTGTQTSPSYIGG
jgi:hypothetical protein